MDFIKIDDPAVKDRMIEKIRANKFSRYVGYQFVSVESGRVDLSLEMKEFHHQQNGYAHGGLISAMCDIAAGFAAYTSIPVDQQVVTGEIKVSYYRAGKGEVLYASGYVVKAGKRVMFCEADVYYLDENRKKIDVAKATTSMIVIGNIY